MDPQPSTPPHSAPDRLYRRVLALDVGEKRIGVALSDEAGQFAMPLTTVQAQPLARALAQISALVLEHGIELIVIGWPLTLSGEVGVQAHTTQAFATQLQSHVSVPLTMFDERLTSTVAKQILREMGVKPEKRKQRIDEIAAMVILQDYLDHTRSRANYPPAHPSDAPEPPPTPSPHE